MKIPIICVDERNNASVKMGGSELYILASYGDNREIKYYYSHFRHTPDDYLTNVNARKTFTGSIMLKSKDLLMATIEAMGLDYPANQKMVRFPL